jgi:hypothetical protein
VQDIGIRWFYRAYVKQLHSVIDLIPEGLKTTDQADAALVVTIVGNSVSPLVHQAYVQGLYIYCRHSAAPSSDYP